MASAFFIPLAVQAQVDLNDGAIKIGTVITGDLVSNVSGGLCEGTVYLQNIDLTVAVDADSLVGWKGGTILIYGLGNARGSPSGLTGDAQGLNNIEAPSTSKIYEAWIEQRIFRDRASILVGL